MSDTPNVNENSKSPMVSASRGIEKWMSGVDSN